MKNIHSLQRKLMIMIIGFIFLFITISSFIVANLFIEDAKKESISNINNLAELIANTHNLNLFNDEVLLVDNYLSKFKYVPSIGHVHIYKIFPQPKGITFFASYNKRTDDPTPEKSNRINELSLAKFSKNIIELMMPITHQDKIVGYVYIQTNNKHIKKITKNIFFRLTIIIVLLILITMLIVKSLNRFITDPMCDVAMQIQEISKHKITIFYLKEILKQFLRKLS